MESTVSIPQLETPFKLCLGRYGWFVYNENDSYMGKAMELYGEYGEHECALFSEYIQSGQTVLDVGANMGTHTVFFARHVGPAGTVHAFEPQRIVFQQMCTNITLNSLLNVHCHHQGLGEQAGSMIVPSVNYYRNNSNFGGLSLSDAGIGEKVHISTIDSMELSACHFIKIDVEGMESTVLRGAKQTLTKYRPILYVENDRAAKSAELIQLLEEMKYAMYWHVPLLFNPDNFRQEKKNIYPNTASCNMLCIPEELPQDLPAHIPLDKVTGPQDNPKNFRRM